MNLPQKGLVLVAIPLLSQLVFLTVLALTRGDQRSAQRLAMHSIEVISQAEKCHRLVVETQTDMRGAVLAGDPTFIASYDEAQRHLSAAFTELRALVGDNTAQNAKVEAISARVRQFTAWTNETMRLVTAGMLGEATIRVQSRKGAINLEHVRELLDEFLAAERRLEEARQARLVRATMLQDWVLIGGVVLALVSCSVLLLGLSRSISRRVGVLIDNTRRMAEGRELAARLTGRDEMSELDGMFHRMAESIRQKEQENELFVYSVSHDLRSPLVNLQGFSQELSLVLKDLRGLTLECDLPAEKRQRAERLLDRDAAEAILFIQSAVTRLASIIDALLRLSRAGRVEYRWQQVDVTETITRVVRAMKDSMTSRKARVTIRELPPCCGDPTAIEQIFANLIGNSVNYLDPARPGEIEIGCHIGEGPMTTYYVKDNGLGISEAFQPKVFVAFQRLHPNVAPGEGIGLALVRRVVERHGGTIWLESTPGVGTTFFVSLPSGTSPLSQEPSQLTPISGKITPP